MKILLYGENWEGTHVNCISKVLKCKNIDCDIFDFYSIIHKNYNNRILNKIIREVRLADNEKVINNLLLSKINDYCPDVFIISKGVNIFPETLFEIKKKSIQIINWNPDDFFNAHNNSNHLLNSLELYDIVFSARKHLFDEYRNNGIKNPIYLDWYYIPLLHNKLDNNLEVNKKVTFIGTYSKRREEIISSIDKKYVIEIWGSGWNFSKLKLKKNIKFNKILMQRDFPKIISTSLVNLNILTLENRDETNLKIFEITASNGLLLSEFNETSNEILKNGTDCLYYNANISEELNIKIDYIYNIKNQEYENFRTSGHLKILSNQNAIDDRIDLLLNRLAK